MGCIFSRQFVAREGVPGQDALAMELFEELGLDKSDVDIFYTAFCDMDADDSNVIRRDEFFAYFKLEKNKLSESIIQTMNTFRPGYLNFSEMVGFVWDFLSREPTALGSFAFYLVDKKKTGYLDRDGLMSIVELLHHTSAAKHGGVKKLAANICNAGEMLSVSDFHEYCQHRQEICVPLVGLQLSLQERMLGKSFWADATRKRLLRTEQLHPDYIYRLFETFHKKLNKALGCADMAIQPAYESMADEKEKRRTSLMYHFYRRDKPTHEKPIQKQLPKKKRRRRSSLGGFVVAPRLLHSDAKRKKKEKKDSSKNHDSAKTAKNFTYAVTTTQVLPFDEDEVDPPFKTPPKKKGKNVKWELDNIDDGPAVKKTHVSKANRRNK